MNKTKQIYETPQIDEVLLDSEISLILSSPPAGNDETMDYKSPDVFKANEPINA